VGNLLPHHHSEDERIEDRGQNSPRQLFKQQPDLGRPAFMRVMECIEQEQHLAMVS
jgi:hypothetical protein